MSILIILCIHISTCIIMHKSHNSHNLGSFLYFAFHDVEMLMFYFITFPLNSFQDRLTPDLSFPTHFRSRKQFWNVYIYTRSPNQLSWLVTILILVSFIEAYRSINKEFNVDSFLDWEHYHWVFTRFAHLIHTRSRDRSSAFATKTAAPILHQILHDGPLSPPYPHRPILS